MKKVVLILLFPILSVNAGTLDTLKNKPASMYDIGKVQLELGTYILNSKMKGKKVKGTDFKFYNFSIEEKPKKLFFKMSLSGIAKDLNPEMCNKMSGLANSILPKEKLMKDIWPGLSAEEYTSLSNQFIIKTELISNENKHFKIDC